MPTCKNMPKTCQRFMPKVHAKTCQCCCKLPNSFKLCSTLDQNTRTSKDESSRISDFPHKASGRLESLWWPRSTKLGSPLFPEAFGFSLLAEAWFLPAPELQVEQWFLPSEADQQGHPQELPGLEQACPWRWHLSTVAKGSLLCLSKPYLVAGVQQEEKCQKEHASPVRQS